MDLMVSSRQVMSVVLNAISESLTYSIVDIRNAIVKGKYGLVNIAKDFLLENSTATSVKRGVNNRRRIVYLDTLPEDTVKRLRAGNLSQVSYDINVKNVFFLLTVFKGRDISTHLNDGEFEGGDDSGAGSGGGAGDGAGSGSGAGDGVGSGSGAGDGAGSGGGAGNGAGNGAGDGAGSGGEAGDGAGSGGVAGNGAGSVGGAGVGAGDGAGSGGGAGVGAGDGAGSGGGAGSG